MKLIYNMYSISNIQQESFLLFIKVFKTLEGSLGVFDDGEGNIRTSLHGDGHEAGDYDNHNVTYSEKVNQTRSQRSEFLAIDSCKIFRVCS